MWSMLRIEAADGQRFQVIDSRGLLHFFSKGGIFRGNIQGRTR